MKTQAFCFLYVVFLLLFFWPRTATGIGLTDVLDFLTRKIPPRPLTAMTGLEFARYVLTMDRPQREAAIVTELLQGNFPNFLRKLRPLQLLYRANDRRTVVATIFTMPDYLAIGSDADYLLIPMNLKSAFEVGGKFGFILPTRKIVDAIYRKSDYHLTPEPLPAGPEMRSTQYYVKHNQKISEQRLVRGVPLDALVAGHKKDVVITGQMVRNPYRIAIYGWHRQSGIPIQPLSMAHNADYADYSHGIRLVSDVVLINKEPRSIYSILQDHLLAGLLSDEGPLTHLSQFWPVHSSGESGFVTAF